MIMTATLVKSIPKWGPKHDGRLTPRANWGRWIVDCPRCHSALAIDPEFGWRDFRMNANHGREFFECWDCGVIAEIEWPPDELIFGAERLLMMRPDPNTRNFDPTKETLTELMWENGEHGIFDGLDLLDLHGVSDHLYLSVSDDKIKQDRLPEVGYWAQRHLSRMITAG
jgi:hypothetical protein